MNDSQRDQLCINTIRTLAMDAVQQANSGHPGTPMAMAPVAYCLWQRFLRFDPQDPIWPNRDRFVLSAGHASMLLYSLLHLTGVKAVSKDYETLGEPSVPLDDDQALPPARQPVSGPSGVPLDLGRGDDHGSARPRDRHKRRHGDRRPLDGDAFQSTRLRGLINFNVYALCGDGCMMEGISHEAASLAGHLALPNLCWIYDNNHITIEGNTSLAYSDDVATRFLGYGWNVTRVGDANDLAMLERAFRTFHKTTDRPTLIIVDSHIAYGAPTSKIRRPLTANRSARRKSGSPSATTAGPKTHNSWSPKGSTSTSGKGIGARGKQLRDAWFAQVAEYKKKYPELADQLYRMQHRQLPEAGTTICPRFPPMPKASPRRDVIGQGS